MDNDLATLLRGLVRMQASDPSAYKALTKFIDEIAKKELQALVACNDDITIHRLQGSIQTLNHIKEHIDNPIELMRSIEQNLS